MGKVSLVSLGCPKNRVDSDNLLDNLRKEGFLFTPEPEEADIVFINTCGFIEEAKRESIEEILKLKKLKSHGKKLVVFGCLAERYRNELRKEIPEIDGLWGVGEDDEIVEYCKKIAHRTSTVKGQNMRKSRRSQAPGGGLLTHPYAYLKIADGCNRGCTFCVIPAIRGPFKSSEPDRILRKTEEYIRSGMKELILVAQDIANYGKELKGYSLPSLLRDIASVSGDFWIRLLYLYPTAITDELLSVVAGEDKVCKYLDIPLQHSEDKILKAMGRSGTRQRYVQEIQKIREAIPDVTLRTTCIVGFPGETDEDFDGLKRFVEEMRFERLGVFTYSREEGTPAYGMKGNVRKGIKDRRRDEILRIQSHVSLDKNRALVGRRFRALVDEVEGGVAVARLSSQAPEIDGVLFIEDGTVKKGEFVCVQIQDAYDYDLKGEVIR
ncbi:MAG: 30S ribosomal protein S12 methylthiotransferase RimO [Thermodesulfovibrionales bacterium]|jgi:ribosomal protein S12 methylthiotransferase